jgi:hypothetical protein
MKSVVACSPLLLWLYLLQIATFPHVCLSFGFRSSTKASPKSTALRVDEALTLYQKKYPAKPRGKQSFLVSLGMPVRDIDGTLLTKTKPKPGQLMGRRFSERSVPELTAAYQELVRLYGETAAFQMVRDMPLILAFDSKAFAPSLAAFSDIFGAEPAQAMVRRNPGLLALPPTGAGGADSVTDQTMQFSYIVAATRPLGAAGVYGLLALLCEPALEALTGIPLKSLLLSSVGLSSSL